MFYYPRKQAIRIQETLKTIYQAVNGEYYVGESAWEYIHKKTEINLKQLLIEIVEDRRKKGE